MGMWVGGGWVGGQWENGNVGIGEGMGSGWEDVISGEGGGG